MASKVNGTTTTFSKYQAAEFEGLEALDARWKHISDNIIPQTPYILTLPSAIPYPRDPRLAHEWMKDGPFEAHEEQLQYLSFIRNWDDGLIVPVGGWDDDKGGIAKESPPEQRRSETNTPKQGQTAGKKISLADYKLKRAAGQLGSKTAEKPTKEADQATTMSREASKSSLPTSSSEEHALPEGSLKRCDKTTVAMMLLTIQICGHDARESTPKLTTATITSTKTRKDPSSRSIQSSALRNTFEIKSGKTCEGGLSKASFAVGASGSEEGTPPSDGGDQCTIQAIAVRDFLLG